MKKVDGFLMVSLRVTFDTEPSQMDVELVWLVMFSEPGMVLYRKWLG